MVSFPFSLGNPATFAFNNRNSSSASCSPLSPVFASTDFPLSREEGTYAERSNIKERTALCESVVAGAQERHKSSLAESIVREALRKVVRWYTS
ncbi:hypothetical protein ASPTUDRAFT_52327 [Aspergillus tubingensis CBS 134.48]|uniref:Uncharacterized protein n=1 Tax=Aspergillus tubingensis (strain CBS 134.48) TaxID=767770 RepID=A0A1L9NMK2_ASPTC|nr:hypothetical protein ASPTUDRAFT_52327 [Aspergillus tubingensis CBS 134.48]